MSFRGAGSVPAVFFVLFFLYVWQYLDPRVLYYADRVSPRPGYLMSFPVFSMGMGFFRDFLSYPGGLSEYASALPLSVLLFFIRRSADPYGGRLAFLDGC